MSTLDDIPNENLVGIFVAGFVCSTLAGIGGIGGGGMLIPLYSIIGNLDIKDAIVLSIITIAGNSFVRAIYYSTKKHKNANNRFLPNYDIIKIIVPFDGNTAYLGFLLNQIMPNIIIFIIILFILAILIYKIIRKAVQIYRDEDTTGGVFIIYDNIEATLPVQQQEITDRSGDAWKDLFNYYVPIVFCFGILTFFTIIRTNSTIKWAIYITQFIFMIMMGYILCTNIFFQYKLKKASRFNFVEGDIKWDEKINFWKYIGSGSAVGLVSTMLGIGGGMIINPIIINLNVPPDVVVATSSISTFFSSFISILQFIMEDGIFRWYYFVLFGLGSLSSIVGLIVIKISKDKMKFIIVLLLAISIVSSFILLCVYNILDIMKNGVS